MWLIVVIYEDSAIHLDFKYNDSLHFFILYSNSLFTTRNPIKPFIVLPCLAFSYTLPLLFLSNVYTFCRLQYKSGLIHLEMLNVKNAPRANAAFESIPISIGNTRALPLGDWRRLTFIPLHAKRPFISLPPPSPHAWRKCTVSLYWSASLYELPNEAREQKGDLSPGDAAGLVWCLHF